MRIITTSYEVAGPVGMSKITTFQIKGLRLRKKVLVKKVSVSAEVAPKKK